MLKDLLDIVADLQLTKEQHGSFSVVSTSFWKSKLFRRTVVRTALPKDEKELRKTTRKDCSILEIAVDGSDPEICLITGYLTNEEQNSKRPMIYNDFIDQIERLSLIHNNHEILSSSWSVLDDNHNGRIDRPITAVFVDEDEMKILLVEAD